MGKNLWNMSLAECFKKAEDEGYIEDANDPYADLGCFGSYAEDVFRCYECPLRYHCYTEHERTLQ